MVVHVFARRKILDDVSPLLGVSICEVAKGARKCGMLEEAEEWVVGT